MKKSQRIISVAPDGEDADGVAELTPDCEIRDCTVNAELHGLRLDHALVRLVPEFSRNYLQQVIEAGDLVRNGKRCRKAALHVRAHDRLSLTLRPTPQSRAFVAEPMALKPIYEDDHLWVIDKPAGLVVHPAPGHWSGTLMNGLLALDARQFDVPRAGIVHRLDKDTSGVMVVARSRAAMDALVRALAARTVRREYLALVHGHWPHPGTLQIDRPIGRDPVNRQRMAVVDLASQSGKPARTDVQCLSQGAAGALLRCRLHTGRTHQIRVHLASLGFALVADTLYAGRPLAGLQRQALHARWLAFDHPITGQAMSFVSPLCADMRDAMAAWGLKYNADSD